MKFCQMCGCEVEEGVSVCPECGNRIADTSAFSLRAREVKKKASNPMGTTVSTGSGLTDILRGEDDEDVDESFGSISGSMPVSLSMTQIDGDYSSKKNRRVGKMIFRLFLLAALAAGIYFFVVHIILANSKARSYNEAIKFIQESINDNDVDKMMKVIPPFMTDPETDAKDFIDSMGSVYIDDYDTKDLVEYDKDQKEALQDAIKLQTSKTSRILEAYDMTVDFKTEIGGSTSHIEMPMTFVNIADKWYMLVGSYSIENYN